MIDVSVIIVNWNAKDVLRKCLNSIINFTKDHSYEIIVIDNNSSDNSSKMVKEEFPLVKLIENNTNLGFAAANNQGLKICSGENILLLNPDTELIDPALDRLLDFLARERFDVVTCKLLNSDGSLQRSVFKFRNVFRSFFENRMINLINFLNLNENNFRWLSKMWTHDEIVEIDWARGAVILFPRYILEKVGMLDERFFIFSEEIDFYLRVRKAGFISGFTPDVKIIHHGSVSTKQVRFDMVVQNYRSYYKLIKKHYGSIAFYTYKTMVIFDLLINMLKCKLKSNKENFHRNKDLFLLHFKKDGI